MQINSDINILGSLPDWNLIILFFEKDRETITKEGGFHAYTNIKTDKSIRLFEKAITNNFLKFQKDEVKQLLVPFLESGQVSNDMRLCLFWNASLNNDLLNYLNIKVFFPAFYSGRFSVKRDEVVACLDDLKLREELLKKWSESTIKMTASKYLTLLKKIGLMEGTANKNIVHPHLNDKMFILYIYWISAVSETKNILVSPWLRYNFSDKNIFIERILKKRYSKYFNIIYTGDKLQVEPLIPYNEIYESITKS